jgi:hypothetical protein
VEEGGGGEEEGGEEVRSGSWEWCFVVLFGRSHCRDSTVRLVGQYESILLRIVWISFRYCLLASVHCDCGVCDL